MGQLFGLTFAIYLFAAAIMVPLFGFVILVEKRDCELIHQEPCVWSVSPDTRALSEPKQ